MEVFADNLIRDFEAGRITRRDLVRKIAALSAGLAVTGATTGSADAQTETSGDREDHFADELVQHDWQKALMEGVVNAKLQYKSEADDPDAWVVGAHHTTSSKHRQWLFDRDEGLYGKDVAAIRTAIQKINATVNPTDTSLQPVFNALTQLELCGALGQRNTSTHPLYDYFKLKINHVVFEVSHELYANATGGTQAEVQNQIVATGSKLYFGIPGKEAEFKAMLDNDLDKPEKLEEDSHEW